MPLFLRGRCCSRLSHGGFFLLGPHLLDFFIDCCMLHRLRFGGDDRVELHAGLCAAVAKSHVPPPAFREILGDEQLHRWKRLQDFDRLRDGWSADGSLSDFDIAGMQ